MNTIDINDVLVKEITNAVIRRLAITPTGRVINLDKVSLEDFKNYLNTTHAILFADWIVSSSDGHQKAAQWLAHTLDEFYIYLNNKEAINGNR